MSGPRGIWLLLLVVLLSACAGKLRRDDAGWRPAAAADAVPVDHFRLAGRLAVSDGREGGSASFLWTQLGERYEFELRQPVSQRTWRLVGDGRGAVLEGGDHGPRRGASAELLLREVLGWEVPVRSLRFWALGRSDPAVPAQQHHDDHGRLSVLEQGGWQVSYGAWLDGEIHRPTRIQARQSPYSVRMNVQEWFVRNGG